MVFKRLVVHFDDICERCCTALNARKVVPADCVYGVLISSPYWIPIKKAPQEWREGPAAPLRWCVWLSNLVLQQFRSPHLIGKFLRALLVNRR